MKRGEMEKDDIKRAAEEAVSALNLDCKITDITRPLGKNVWCIQFTGSYGQFCDEFHDKEGKDNSHRVVREKIKRYFIKLRKPTRIVRGRAPAAARRERQAAEGGLLETLFEAGGQVLKQATRITSEVVERTTNLNEAALNTGAEWVEGLSPTAAALIRTDDKGTPMSAGPPPARTVEPVSHDIREPASRTVIKKKKAAAKASPKKAAKKKAAKKRASKKRSVKTGKKTSKKKKTGKKKRSSKAVRLLF